jgi:hypothetical protein
MMPIDAAADHGDLFRKAGRYARPTFAELKGRTPLTAVPGVIIDWDQVLARML